MIWRLPLPPSSNNIVRPVLMGRSKRGKPMVRLVSTSAARDFREAVHAKLPTAPVGGLLELYVTMYVPTISSDVSNRLKALEDACNGRLWWDDKQIAEIHCRKVVTCDPHEVGVVLEVKPADPLEHPEFAKRLAVSSIAEKAAEQDQVEFELEPAEAPPATPPHAPVRLPMPEPLQAKLRRLAEPASYPPEPPEAA